ncbi:MAG: GAF domain-containing protein [Chloroflexota bacterium]
MDEKKQSASKNKDIVPQGRFWGTIVLNLILMAIYVYAFPSILSAEATTVITIAITCLALIIAATVVGLILTIRRQLDAGLLLTFTALHVLVIMIGVLFQGRALSGTFSLLLISAIGFWWLYPRPAQKWYLSFTAVTLALIWLLEWFSPAWRQTMKIPEVGPVGAITFGIISAIVVWYQSREAIRRSLRIRITVWAGTILVLSSTILVVYSALTARQSAIRSAETEALSFASSQARQVQADTEIPLDMARSLAQALTAVKNPAEPITLTRDQVNAMLRQVLSENESFLGTYTLWEPNAFDGQDSDYVNATAHDASGRFIPYWVRADDGSISVIALEQYETPGIGDWYLLPRQTKKEVTIAPLIYPIEGVDTVMASFVVPIVNDETFYGIAGIDAPIAFVQTIVDSVDLYDGKADAVLLTSSGTLIGVRNRPELVNQPATEIYADFSDLQARIEAGETFISLSPDGQFLRVFAPVEIGQTDAHWTFGLIIPFAEITAPATDSAIRQATISAALILIAMILLWYLTGQIVRPIRDLTTVANNIVLGDLNAVAETKTEDETGILAATFNSMTSRLRGTLATLEDRVAERTHSLELAAEVGRSVSQVRALDIMLKDAAEIIRARFDLYYVQVYLTNPTQDTLILQAGTGSVGAQLIGRGHRLPISIASINGRAAVEKLSVVIANTTTSPTFLPNPLLPETRSEMAIPLTLGDKVVGVLDLQSSKEGALSEELLPAFEALAGQLAIAIRNASLLAETEQARAEVEAQARRLVRRGWDEYLDAIHKPEKNGFKYEGDAVVPLEADTEPSAAEDDAISAPISITGEPVGSLVVEMSKNAQTAQKVELVKIVARQVAQQLENLRLLDSAERYRVEAEQASRRLTQEGWKEYVATRGQENLGYRYDLKEVRPQQEIAGVPSEEPVVTLPIKVRDETIGKLAVEGLSPDDDASLALVNMVAERLGAHIESLRQYDRTQSALAQSEKLFEASRVLTQARDLQELTASTVRTLDIPEINRAVLATFNYDSEDNIDSLDIIANWWNGTGHEITPVGTHYPLEVIRVMPMFVSPTPVFFNDTSTDKRVDATTMQLVQRLNLRAVAVLPLFSGTRQIGALILEAEEPHTFTPEETRLFASLAPQIATVLENRRQFERAQKQAERESTLNLISQKIQSATSVEAVLQIAARELGHALGAPLTIAQLGVKDGK